MCRHGKGLHEQPTTIGGLLAAWLFAPFRPELVFPVAAIAVGAHYFGFRTAYGDWTNWVLGGAMCVVGILSVCFSTPRASLVPYLIATIEIAFGAYLTYVSVRDLKQDSAAAESNNSG